MYCTEEDCKEQAIYTYVWPWGAQGACCAQHSLTIRQKASQQLDIPGGLMMVAIASGEPPPISRDERVQMRARVIVAEEEIAELKVQLARLEQARADIASQAQRYYGAMQSLEVELHHASVKVNQLIDERDAALAAQTELRQKLQRFEVLAAAPTPAGMQSGEAFDPPT